MIKENNPPHDDNASQKPLSQPTRLTYASTQVSADAWFLAGTRVPDAFIALEDPQGQRMAVVRTLEYDRLRKSSGFHEVHSYEVLAQQAKAQFGEQRPKPEHILKLLCQQLGLQDILVGEDFPAGLYARMLALGLPVRIAEGMLFPERARKTEREVEAIRKANKVASFAFKEVERILQASTIEDKTLFYDGKKLNSEDLQEAIGKICLSFGAQTECIVAGGLQACDPHEHGHGPLKANELIIVDIFPRIMKTGFHGDMTRTYLKGQPSKDQSALVEAVRHAQRRALSCIRAGANGSDVFKQAKDVFDKKGFETGQERGRNVGFFHGLGHGLGLEVHEYPRVGTENSILEEGHVVTVEPGLYYPSIGGCRIEDVVLVTSVGARLLSRHPYRWVFA